MELAEYIDKKKAELRQIHGAELNNQAWGEILSQIKSGINLGLDMNDCNRYATLKFNYAQREIIKYACFSGISREYVDRLIKEADDKKLPYKAMIDMIDEWKYSSKDEKALAKQIEIVVDNLRRLDERTVVDAIEKKDLEFVTKQMELKDKEIERLRRENQNLTKDNKQLRGKISELEQDKEQQTVSTEDVSKKKGLFKKKASKGKSKCLDANEKVIPAQKDISSDKPIAFKVEPLPEGFDLSTYMLNSDLSASQMQIITVAVKLGINQSIIKQMVDSGRDATKLKQVLEVLVVQMEQEKSNLQVNETRAEDLFEEVDIALFESEIDKEEDIDNNQSN